MITMILRRIVRAVLATFDVYAEAQAMARAAHRRYPFAEE